MSQAVIASASTNDNASIKVETKPPFKSSKPFMFGSNAILPKVDVDRDKSKWYVNAKSETKSVDCTYTHNATGQMMSYRTLSLILGSRYRTVHISSTLKKDKYGKSSIGIRIDEALYKQVQAMEQSLER